MWLVGICRTVPVYGCHIPIVLTAMTSLGVGPPMVTLSEHTFVRGSDNRQPFCQAFCPFQTSSAAQALCPGSISNTETVPDLGTKISFLSPLLTKWSPTLVVATWSSKRRQGKRVWDGQGACGLSGAAVSSP